MSCIAGLGGDVKSLVKLAHSGRTIIVIDGCSLACALHCLSRHGIAADTHLELQEFGVEKNLHADFDPVQTQQVIAGIIAGPARRPVDATKDVVPTTADAR